MVAVKDDINSSVLQCCDRWTMKRKRAEEVEVLAGEKRPETDSNNVGTVFAKDGSYCRLFSRRPAGAEAVAFSADSAWVAIGRADGQIDIYDANGAYRVMSLPGSEDTSVRFLAFVRRTVEPDRISAGRAAAALSLFNYRLFSTGLHGTITEWDLRLQTKRFESPSFGGAVFGADVSAAAGLLVIVTDDGGPRVFKLRSDNGTAMLDAEDDDEVEETLTYSKTLTKHTARLLCVCIYQDRWAYAGTADGKLIRWDLETGHADAKLAVGERGPTPVPKFSRARTVPETDGTQAFVWSVVALPDHGLVASGDSLGCVSLWDTQTLTLLKAFRSHEADVLGLAYSSQIGASSLFSVGVDGRMCIFSTVDGSQAWSQTGCRYPHLSDIRAVAVASSGLLVTAASDGTARVFTDLRDLNTATLSLPGTSAVAASQWLQFCEPLRLVMTTFPRKVELWCLTTQQSSTVNPVKVASVELGGDGGSHIRSSALSPDGRLIAVSNDAGTRLFKLDLEELNVEAVAFKRVRSLVCTAMRFATIGGITCLLTASVAKTSSGGDFGRPESKLTIWDMHEKRVLATFDDAPSAVQGLDISPDSQWIAARSFSGRVWVYSVDRLQRVADVPEFPRMVRATADRSNPIESVLPAPSLGMAAAFVFSPDSKHLVVFRSKPKFFMVYDISAGQLVVVPSGSSFQTPKPGILKVPSLTCRDGEVGDIQWVDGSTLFIRTARCLATVRFTDASLLTQGSAKAHRAKATPPEEFLKATVLHQGPTSKQQLVVFTQARHVPEAELPPTFRRKRYGT